MLQTLQNIRLPFAATRPRALQTRCILKDLDHDLSVDDLRDLSVDDLPEVYNVFQNKF